MSGASRRVRVQVPIPVRARARVQVQVRVRARLRVRAQAVRHHPARRPIIDERRRLSLLRLSTAFLHGSPFLSSILVLFANFFFSTWITFFLCCGSSPRASRGGAVFFSLLLFRFSVFFFGLSPSADTFFADDDRTIFLLLLSDLIRAAQRKGHWLGLPSSWFFLEICMCVARYPPSFLLPIQI